MILLPLLALLTWILAFRRTGRDWLESSAAALLVFGVAVSMTTELQSLTATMTREGSAIAWLLVAMAGLFVLRRGAEPVPLTLPSAGALIRLAPVLGLVALTAAVALLSAPNSYDGLSHHLIRPERWIQQGSLRPFATHDTRQLFMPSWAEYAMLQLRLLSGGDHFANLVQWIGYVGSALGAALVARFTGGGRLASGLAALLVVTVPMAVAQASGTQTDVIAACWTVMAAGFAYRLLAPSAGALDALLAAAGLGLSAATKQTALLFAALIVLPVLGLGARAATRRVWGVWIAASALATLSLAGPQLWRNREVFGSWQGDPSVVRSVASAARGPGHIAGSMLRNLTVHFGTPWEGLNRALVRGVTRANRAMGVDPDDPRTTWAPPYKETPWTTHEEFSPNPLHLLLILGSAAAFLVSRPRGIRLVYLAGLALGFVAYCALIKWQIYAARLHTPLFVLGLAWAAVELERLPRRARRILVGLLFLAALPAAVLNYTRPLVSFAPIAPRPSLLRIPRNLHYFLYMPHLGYGYWDVARKIAERDCADVGVRAGTDAWEYPVIAIARSGGSEARFRSIDVTNQSARFARGTAAPCLLLLIGPGAGRPPDWARDWRPVADWHQPLGSRGIALYEPAG